MLEEFFFIFPIHTGMCLIYVVFKINFSWIYGILYTWGKIAQLISLNFSASKWFCQLSFKTKKIDKEKPIWMFLSWTLTLVLTVSHLLITSLHFSSCSLLHLITMLFHLFLEQSNLEPVINPLSLPGMKLLLSSKADLNLFLISLLFNWSLTSSEW